MYGVVLTHSARSGSDTFGMGCFPVTKMSGAARRCEHLQDIQHSAAQGVAVMKTSGAARRCEHLQDIQHSSADSAVVVTKTCSAAQRCQHLLDIETAWHNVPLLPLLAECVRTTPGRISSSDSAENCENCENCGNCGNCDNCDNCDNWKNSFEMMENWGELQNCKNWKIKLSKTG